MKRSALLPFGERVITEIHGGHWSPDGMFDTYCGLTSRKAFEKPFTATTEPQDVTCECCRNEYERM